MAASVAVCSCNLPQFVSSSRATLRQSRSRDPSDDSGALYASVLAKRRQAPRARRLAVTGRSSDRSEEHTSELQSLMRISYAVFCLKKKKTLILNAQKYIQQIN